MINGLDSLYSRTRREPAGHPALDADIETDILIIGGGLAGCCAALDLAERGRKVVLLEAHGIGWGASGRNGGFVSEGFPGGYRSLAARVGLGKAKLFHQWARMGHALLRERIERHAIQCGPIQSGALICNIAGRGDDLQDFRAYMATNFDLDYDHWPRDKLVEALSTEQYTDALFNPRTYALHPLDLNLGLARACVEAGVKIFEASPALSLEIAGARKQAVTPRGRVRADHMIIACGGYVDGLNSTLSGATIPIATFVMATEPLGDKLRAAIRVPYAISDNQVGVNYYRPLADGRLLWGGRVLAWQPSDRRIAKLLHADMARFYPSLRDAKVEVAWGGYMPFTRHKLPVIGQIARDVWFATGFGGLGVALTTTTGRLIADAITEGDDSWRQFESFGLPYAGGKWGRIPAQIIYWRHALAAKHLRRR